ncbi:MAG: hypothetical protein ACR2HX_14980 [Pyrinomonadaceae bacterium]
MEYHGLTPVLAPDDPHAEDDLVGKRHDADAGRTGRPSAISKDEQEATKKRRREGRAVRASALLRRGSISSLRLSGKIFPRIRERLLQKTLFPTESNPKRERDKMDRLRQYLTLLMPTFFEPATPLPLITDILSLLDLLLTTGEVAIPMFSRQPDE